MRRLQLVALVEAGKLSPAGAEEMASLAPTLPLLERPDPASFDLDAVGLWTLPMAAAHAIWATAEAVREVADDYRRGHSDWVFQGHLEPEGRWRMEYRPILTLAALTELEHNGYPGFEDLGRPLMTVAHAVRQVWHQAAKYGSMSARDPSGTLIVLSPLELSRLVPYPGPDGDVLVSSDLSSFHVAFTQPRFHPSAPPAPSVSRRKLVAAAAARIEVLIRSSPKSRTHSTMSSVRCFPNL